MSYFLSPIVQVSGCQIAGIRIADIQLVIDSGTLLQDRFLIEDQIGSGGMGAVYRAIDQKFGSRVAIKETFYGGTELSTAFEREARLLNGLHHPIFPHVSDSFSENGGHFLVMEYIEGEDLSELLKQGEIFDVDTVVRWAFELLDGLDYLHSQDPPVIHRDIKPNNLKLTTRGKLVLLDFGMAKETSSNTASAKSVFGYSRRYSPLEQIEGIGTDERSDIFSLGASLYHLMTGIPPADVLARASAIVAGKPDPLIPANLMKAYIPESVADVLETALAINLENRFESARAMSDALESAIAVGDVSLEQRDASGVLATSSQIASPPTDEIAPFAEPDPPSGPRVVAIDDAYPQMDPPPGVQAGNGEGAFTHRTAFQNLGNRIGLIVPQAVRVRKVGLLSTAMWFPIILLCLALVAWGTYRGLTRSEEKASAESAPVETQTSAPEVANAPVETQGTASEVATAPPEEEIPEAQSSDADDVVAEDDAPSETVGARAADNPIDLRKGPVVSEPETTRRASNESSRETRVVRAKEPEVMRPTARRTQRQQAASERPSRRRVKPAFEQPAVSSIEAIMTGIPYERRSRWDYQRDSWEEERRRRRMRRMRRYQQPY